MFLLCRRPHPVTVLGGGRGACASPVVGNGQPGRRPPPFRSPHPSPFASASLCASQCALCSARALMRRDPASRPYAPAAPGTARGRQACAPAGTRPQHSAAGAGEGESRLHGRSRATIGRLPGASCYTGEHRAGQRATCCVNCDRNLVSVCDARYVRARRGHLAAPRCLLESKCKCRAV